MLKPDNYGVSLSLLIHALILVMPVSMVVTKHFKEVELFVINETPKPQIIEKKLKPTPPSKQLVMQQQPQPVVEPEPQIIEPSIPATRQDAPILPASAKPASEPPKVIAPPAPPPKPMLDVEFGSPNAPLFLHREMPVYPLIARRLGKEGRVLLRLTIDEKGKLLNVEVIEDAGYGFADAAVEAVKKSTFKPATQDGKAVMSKALLPIRFTLRRD